jgi:hypothetical protein
VLSASTATTDSPRRRLVRSSTCGSRFHTHTQAHHRQLLARYPFIHSEEFDKYSTYAFRPSPPPLQIDQTRDSMGYIKLNRKLEGRRGRQCVANAALGPSHLTLFVLKNLHLSSSYVRQSPTTNDLVLTDDDTKTLPMICNFLNTSSKALGRTPNSKSSASSARSGQVQCLPCFSASVWQSSGRACGTRPAPALRVQRARVRKKSLVFSYPHCPTAEHCVGSKLQDRPDGDVLSLGQHHTVGAGEETRPTRAVEPRRAPHYPTPPASLIEVEVRVPEVRLDGTRV